MAVGNPTAIFVMLKSIDKISSVSYTIVIIKYGGHIIENHST